MNEKNTCKKKPFLIKLDYLFAWSSSTIVPSYLSITNGDSTNISYYNDGNQNNYLTMTNSQTRVSLNGQFNQNKAYIKNVQYLIVGGGGGGSTTPSGGGGGGGQVLTGNFKWESYYNYVFFNVGSGGTPNNNGQSSSLGYNAGTIATASGGERGILNNGGNSGNSNVGYVGSSILGGGGGGSFSGAFDENGGAGTQWTYDPNTSNYYGSGGGGGFNQGGNSSSNSTNGTLGGGGGGSGTSSDPGGSGGNGVIILYWNSSDVYPTVSC